MLFFLNYIKYLKRNLGMLSLTGTQNNPIRRTGAANVSLLGSGTLRKLSPDFSLKFHGCYSTLEG